MQRCMCVEPYMCHVTWSLEATSTGDNGSKRCPRSNNSINKSCQPDFPPRRSHGTMHCTSSSGIDGCVHKPTAHGHQGAPHGPASRVRMEGSVLMGEWLWESRATVFQTHQNPLFAKASALADLWPRPNNYYNPQINITNSPGIEIKIAKEAPGNFG